MYDYQNNTALVTGASRGIGAEIARELAVRGIGGLILTARTRDDLDTLAEEIRTKHGTPVTVIVADLAQSDTPAHLKAEVDARGLHVDLLVNNAGFGAFGYFETTDPERSERVIAVNVEAVVKLTHLFLPGMVERNRGAILNVASTASFQPLPFMAIYGATKAFVLSFSEALWAENRKRGIRVVCLCPGATETAFDGGNAETVFDSTPKSSAIDVAKVGLDALEKNTLTVVEGNLNKFGTLLPRFLPRSAAAQVAGYLLDPANVPGKKGKDKTMKETPSLETSESSGMNLPVPVLAMGLVMGSIIIITAVREFWKRKA